MCTTPLYSTPTPISTPQHNKHKRATLSRHRRFEFSVPLTQEEGKHSYSLKFTPPLPGDKGGYTFVTPALGKPLRWGFKSCDWCGDGLVVVEVHSACYVVVACVGMENFV